MLPLILAATISHPLWFCGPISPDAVPLIGYDGFRLGNGETIPWDQVQTSPDQQFYACVHQGKVMAFWAPLREARK